jgi:hypothetical protein
MPEGDLDPRKFAQSFQGFMDTMHASAPKGESAVFGRLKTHFGVQPADLTILSESFEKVERPNLQRALETFTQRGTAELFGVKARFSPMGTGLADIDEKNTQGVNEAPPEFENVHLADGEILSCLHSGIYLLGDGDCRSAISIRGPQRHDFRSQVRIEVMAPTTPDAERVLGELRAEMIRLNVYKGHVISLESNTMQEVSVRYHRLPSIERQDIILSSGLLDRIERQSSAATVHRDRLLSSGRHLKRGILLHGPPGTGKTLTAMYLAGQLEERTVFLVTGTGMGLLARTCRMARFLEPSMVIIEDVDLIAEERKSEHSCGALLFELLNIMDGLNEDVDVVFLLTTNRPDLLEPALAARPGRIDLAVEVPLPEASERAQLFELYGEGLTMDVSDPDELVRKTEGASGAFIRELLRKAAILAAPSGDPITVRDEHIRDAMHELTVAGGAITKSLLGAGDAVGG